MFVINEARFAELNKGIVQMAIESQNAKKSCLLEKVRLTSAMKEKVPSEVKMTHSQTLSYYIDKWRERSFTISDLSQLVEDVNSKKRLKQYHGAIGIRKLLSTPHPPIQSILDAKLIPRMIEFMQIEEEPQLQLEAAWSLTNISSGTTIQTQAVIDKAAIPWFIKILRSNITDLREQAIWAVGNISGDLASHRDNLLMHGALHALLKIADESNADPKTLETVTWAISNLCRGRPKPRGDYVKDAVPTLFHVLGSQTNPETLQDAARALSGLSMNNEVNLDLIVNCSNGVFTLVFRLFHPQHAIPCLKTLGNICRGGESQIEAVISCLNFFNRIYSLLSHTQRSIRRWTLWVISTITMGTAAQIARLLKSFPFVTKLIGFFPDDFDDVKTEALRVFVKILKRSDLEESSLLCNIEILNCFISNLETTTNIKAIGLILDGIHSLLCLEKTLRGANQNKENWVLMKLEERGLFDKLDTLQDSIPKKSYPALIQLIEDFMPFIEIRPQRFEESEDESDDESEDN